MTQQLRDTSEEILLALRELFGLHGYSRYKMNKFEEYDLYANNKDFLISDSVITFTDGTGRLLALKPDVTLSIVKNSKDTGDTIQKLYYNENVYRVTKGSRNFKEIIQVGLECIGRVDDYCVFEVLKLALESLNKINSRNVLAVSHLGVLSELLDSIGVGASGKSTALRLIGEKNMHEMSSFLSDLGVSDSNIELMRRIVNMTGKPADILPRLTEMLCKTVSGQTLSAFDGTLGALSGEDNLCVDFSVVGDINYYNGFVFKGFAEGIPTSVLSGGQYDMLMRRMGKSSGAVGFAVYLDTVEQFNSKSGEYDVDDLLLYDSTIPLADIDREVKRLTSTGESVMCCAAIPKNIKYRRLLKMNGGKGGENNADS